MGSLKTKRESILAAINGGERGTDDQTGQTEAEQVDQEEEQRLSIFGEDGDGDRLTPLQRSKGLVEKGLLLLGLSQEFEGTPRGQALQEDSAKALQIAKEIQALGEVVPPLLCAPGKCMCSCDHAHPLRIWSVHRNRSKPKTSLCPPKLSFKPFKLSTSWRLCAFALRVCMCVSLFSYLLLACVRVCTCVRNILERDMFISCDAGLG